MERKWLWVAVASAFMLTTVPADQTVGLFINEEEAWDGYTLFSPTYWNKTYLINNEGLLVHSWESDNIPGLGGMAYLSPDGYLYRSILIIEHPKLQGGTGGVEKLDWDGNVVWHFEYTGENFQPHHDIEVLPSGNVLMIAWEIKSNAEAVQAGANDFSLDGREMYPEYIIEVEPVGADSGNIVWEWHSWDHLVQDHNSAVDNFGSVAGHPELIDINARNYLVPDFIHLNTVKYNEEFDQVMLTSRGYHELWVIDHSTTTEQAQRHAGGNYGKGGDLLYRWGNPRFYRYGGMGNEQLFAPHDAHWIASNAPGAGNILIFNNGEAMFNRYYSSIDEIVPPVDEAGNYLGGLPWGPAKPVWTYTAPNRTDLFAVAISGAQRLPNGNTLFCNGISGEFFEVTSEGDLVWYYIDPVSEKGPVFQGDSISNNSVFKIRRYAPDYPAFVGKDMTPGKTVELHHGDTTHVVTEIGFHTNIKLEIRPSVITHSTTINYQLGLAGPVRIKLYNALGQEVRTLVDESKSAGRYQIRWNGTDNSGRKVNSGVYFCKFQTGTTSLQKRIIFIK